MVFTEHNAVCDNEGGKDGVARCFLENKIWEVDDDIGWEEVDPISGRWLDVWDGGK